MHNSKNIGTQSIRELCWNNRHKYQDYAVRILQTHINYYLQTVVCFVMKSLLQTHYF